MSNTPATAIPRMPHQHYLNATYGSAPFVAAYHRSPSALPFFSLAPSQLFFFSGGVPGTMIRIQLLTPRGALVTTPETYNKSLNHARCCDDLLLLDPLVPAASGIS